MTPQWTREVIPLPVHHHHPGPEMGAEHRLPHSKSPEEDVLPVAAEEVQPAKAEVRMDSSAEVHHHWMNFCTRVHPHLLHHTVVCCCYCQRQGQTSAHHFSRATSLWQEAAGHQYQNLTPQKQFFS